MPYIGDSITVEAGVALSVLRTEFWARGYDYLSQDAAGIARTDRWLNQSHASIVLKELWPFRLTTTSGAAPLSIANVGKVLSVIDSDNNDWDLTEMTEREMTPYRLTSLGIPYFYYRDGLTLRLWPSSTHTISVRFYARPAKLVNDADTTMIPERFMDVLIDDAVIRGGKDADNAQVVALARQERDQGLADMREDLMVAPRHIQRSGYHEDG